MFQIEKNKVKSCCRELERMSVKLKSFPHRMEIQKEQVKTADAAAYRQIQKFLEELMEEEVFIHKFCMALEQILAVYEKGENRVTAFLEEEQYPLLFEKLKVNQFQWLNHTDIQFK